MIVTDVNQLRLPIEEIDLDTGLEIISKLEEELSEEPHGIGLAAPQIGIKNKVAIIRFEKDLNLINPVIINRSQPIIIKSEACLSLPGISVDTQRYKEVFVKDLQKPDGFVIVGNMAIALQHECLPSGSRVITPDGDKKIIDIVKNKYNGLVLSMDKNMNVVWDSVVRWNRIDNLKSNKKKWISLKFSHSSLYRQLYCTEDHLCAYIQNPLNPNKILYCKANEMLDKFQIRRFFEEVKKHEASLFNQEQLEALVGSLLGNLCISLNGEGVCNHGKSQEEYSKWKAKIFNGYTNNGFGKEKSNIVCHLPINEQTKYLRKKIYIPEKQITNEILDNISIISIAFWYMDDGSLNSNSCYFHTESFSFKDQEKLSFMLKDKFNINSEIKTRKVLNGRILPYLFISTKDTEKLHKLISPYIHPSMRYKIINRYKDIPFVEISNILRGFSCRLITEIKILNHLESALYDIGTKNNNCFFTEDSLVHNCDHLEGILIIDRATGKNKIKRNDPCPCGSNILGKPVKFKKCHGKTY